MTEEKKSWIDKVFSKLHSVITNLTSGPKMSKFMDIHYLAPFGNDGRGTKIYLYPFVFVAVVAVAAPLINYMIYGTF